MNDTNLHVEVLKIARDLLMDEYVELVNQSEQRWEAESRLRWEAEKVIVPYPDLPAPPTVDIILKTAQMLLSFFWHDLGTECPAPMPEPAPEPEPQPESQPGQ
jgi:hypothetical protein